MSFLFWALPCRFEELNAARTSAAADGSTEANIYLIAPPKEQLDAIKSGRYLANPVSFIV